MKVEIELDDAKIQTVMQSMASDLMRTSGFGSDNIIMKALKEAVLVALKKVKWSKRIDDALEELLSGTVKDVLKSEIAKEARRQLKEMRTNGELFDLVKKVATKK